MPETDFEAAWEAYWEEMRDLCTDLDRQQSVSRETRGLVFDV